MTRSPAATPSNRQTQRKRVLIVDDEKDLVQLIGYNLQRNGYETLSAATGTEAVEVAQRELPDMILLDLMLPGLQGTEVAHQLRSDPRTARIPIIMLTARGEETDVIVGLTLGADDYVTKPFSMKILMARMTAIFRRAETNQATEASGIVTAGPLRIDTQKFEITIDRQPVKLTLTEFKLLAALAGARGRVLSRSQLMDKAIGVSVIVTDRAIDVHITSIRRKLGEANWLIDTVRGVGYRLRESRDEP